MNTSIDQQATPLLVPKGMGPAFDIGDHRGNIAISYRNTNDTFAMGILDVDYQGGVPPHCHTREDEMFYILQGQFTAQVGALKVQAGPGDTLFAPRNIVHTWACNSEAGGRALVVLTPGENFETFFLEMDRRKLIPAQAPFNEALAQDLAALARKHGMEMLPQRCDLPRIYEPLYVPAGEGAFVDLGDHQGWGKVGAQHTGNAFLFSETRSDKNGGVPPHIHHREDETFYILEGQFVFQLGDQSVEAGPGDTIFAPRDILHAWQCTSEGGGRILILFTPGDNFQAFALAMAAQNASPARDMEDPAATAAFVELAARYGIDMIPTIK